MSYEDLVEKIIRNVRESDGIGYEPLIREFVTDVSTLTPQEKEEREIKIRNYYQAIYGRTNNLKQAYEITRNWCNKIFVSKYVSQTINQLRGN